MTSTALLSPATETALLLCGRFGGQSDGLRPLTAAEFNRLASWLSEQAIELDDLLDASGELDWTDELGLDLARIDGLLARGAALALAVERWFNHGIWIRSSTDQDYPDRFRTALPESMPPLLYGVGDHRLLSDQQAGLAIVGSREATPDALEFAQEVAGRAAGERITVVSGGARGIDITAMVATLEAGGAAIGVLADQLNRSAVSNDFRDHIRDQRLTLISPFAPEAGFNIGNAMARNKLIYLLARWALVISSSEGSGGTWAGATENLNNGWVPLFVHAGPNMPAGNMQLIASGGIALNRAILDAPSVAWTLDRSAADASGRWQEFPADPIFDAVWPIIARELETPAMFRELLNRLGGAVRPGQLRDWLEIAGERGLVARKNPQNPYELVGSDGGGGPQQLDLFAG